MMFVTFEVITQTKKLKILSANDFCLFSLYMCEDKTRRHTQSSWTLPFIDTRSQVDACFYYFQHDFLSLEEEICKL